MRQHEEAVSYAPESTRCAAAQPNRLVATSADIGWTSLLVDQMEGSGRSDEFETYPTPDLTLVVAVSSSHEIEVSRNARWHRALYQVDAHARIVSTGKQYKQTYAGLLIAEHGRIKRLREALDTLAAARAFSGDD